MIPKLAAAINTTEDPVCATFVVPRASILGDKKENICVNEADFKLELATTVINATTPWHDLEMSEESDIHDVLAEVESLILVACDWDHCPALEPNTVNETEPEAGELRCRNDEMERKGKMTNCGEPRDTCEPDEIRKAALANPP